nr:hypothetical protein [Tanacetum cinerariifolium]
MRQDLAERLRMVYILGTMGKRYLICNEMGLDITDTLCFQLGGARLSINWRQFILALGLHTTNEMGDDGFVAYWLGSERVIPDKEDLSSYWIEISFDMDFLRSAPSYTYIRDLVKRLCHMLISYIISGRGQTPEKKNTCSGTLMGGRAMSAGGGGGVHVWVLEQPEHPHQYLGHSQHPLGLEEEIQGLRQDVRSLPRLLERLMTDQGRFSTWMISCMTQLMEASGHTHQASDGTFRGSYPEVFKRRIRCRTDDASTLTAQQEQQPDP